jgi:hypothetical protein
MKRWLWVIVLGTIAALLVGCGAASSEASINVRSADDVQRISPSEAKALVDSGEAILYDTRLADAYLAQHAAGAVSFPEEDAAVRIDELPDDGTAIILYCT